MNLLRKLPGNFTQFIGRSPLRRDSIGQSPCHVYEFSKGSDRFFLKHSPAIYSSTTFSVAREGRVIEWLQDVLYVPEIVLTDETEQGQFMITRGIEGLSLDVRTENGQSPVELYLEAIRQLRAVPATQCPFDSRVSYRLEELDYIVRQGLIADDYDLCRWPELTTPEQLVRHLNAAIPQEDLVFSHGDLGGSNILVDSHERLHFIDLGRGGLADKWMDVAFVYRSLQEDVSECAATEFLLKLGEGDNAWKRDYFEQLDELF